MQLLGTVLFSLFFLWFRTQLHMANRTGFLIEYLLKWNVTATLARSISEANHWSKKLVLARWCPRRAQCSLLFSLALVSPLWTKRLPVTIKGLSKSHLLGQSKPKRTQSTCTQTNLWWEALPRKWTHVEDQFQKHIHHLNKKSYTETHSGLVRILLWEEPKP